MTARARRLLACLLAVLLPALPCAAAVSLHGEPPAAGLGGPIDLVDQHSQTFRLERLADRSALVFFGYTHCGTTCPVALAAAREILARSASAPAIVFVSLDPLNDQPAALRAYLGSFDDRIIGLTGTPGAIERVADRYGVGIACSSTAVAHSAKWYLLDPAGRLVRVYGLDTPPPQLAADLDQVARGNPKSMP
jgi:protein SCO1/2